MPQSPKKITEKFEQILKKRITKDLQNLDQTPGDKQVIGTNIKNEIISQMRTELK